MQPDFKSMSQSLHVSYSASSCHNCCHHCPSSSSSSSPSSSMCVCVCLSLFLSVLIFVFFFLSLLFFVCYCCIIAVVAFVSVTTTLVLIFIIMFVSFLISLRAGRDLAVRRPFPASQLLGIDCGNVESSGYSSDKWNSKGFAPSLQGSWKQTVKAVQGAISPCKPPNKKWQAP